MSGVNSDNVVIGAPDQDVTGAILSGGTWPEVAPDTVEGFVGINSETLPAGVVDSGYVSEDGLRLTVDESTKGILDWSLSTVREILESFAAKMAWSHLEVNEQSLRNYMGDDNVKVTDATASAGKTIRAALGANTAKVKPWFFKMKDGQRRVVAYVPKGQITQRGEIAFLGTDAIKLPVTLSTYPDKAGNNIYIYFDDGTVLTDGDAAAPAG